MTVTAPSVLTVPAPKIMAGDVIDSRRVRSVSGRKPMRTSADYFSMSPNKSNSMGAISFSGHIVTVFFEDGPPRHYFGAQSVEVVRDGEAPPETAPPRTGISAVRDGPDLRDSRITGWRWTAFTRAGRRVSSRELTRRKAIDAAERAAA